MTMTISGSTGLTFPNDTTQTTAFTNASPTFTGTVSVEALTASGNVNCDSGTFFVDSVNNRVGVGTTSPSNKLSISGSSGVQADVIDTGGAYATLRTTNGTNTTWFGTDGSSPAIQSVANASVIWGFGAYPTIFGNSNTERMRIDSSGSVGIGTSSPTEKLSVTNTALTSTTVLANTVAGFRSNASGADTNIKLTDGVTYSANIGQINGNLYFAANGTEYMRLTTSGNLGIGTTSPAKRLHLYAVNDAASVRFTNTAANKVWDLTPAYPNVVNSGFSLYNVTDNTVPFYVTDAGNVGIGTSSPATLEHLSSNTNTQLRIETTNTGAVSVTQYKNAEGNVHQIGSETSAGNAGFNGSSAYALCLEAAGSRDICFSAGSALRAKITSAGLFQFNSGYGSAQTAYGCRIWVNFNGQGTIAIRGSGGVSSLTDNGTVNYTVNFSITLPDTNYATAVTNDHDSGSGSNQQMFVLTSSNTSYANKSTTALQVRGYNTTSADFDPYGVNVMVFR